MALLDLGHTPPAILERRKPLERHVAMSEKAAVEKATELINARRWFMMLNPVEQTWTFLVEAKK